MSLGKIGAPVSAAEIAAQQADPTMQAKERAALQKACRDFEGMFLAQMWKEMRKTVQKGGLTDGGFGEEMFSSMLDQAYADSASQRGALGLAKMLEQQLSPDSYARPGGNLPAVRPTGNLPSPYQKSNDILGSPMGVAAPRRGSLSITS